jgi:carboxylate-amine ligase
MRNFRFGIEEEYFVVGRRTGNVRRRFPKQFMRAAKRKLGPTLMYELLQSQIEVATTPITCSRDAHAQLHQFRSTLAEIGKEHDVGIVAAGSHPLALPHQQLMTRKRRYSKLIDDLGLVGLGNPLCGMHVHVEVPQPERRVDIMHRLVPFLPLLLALSTSSPFWAGSETGLLGYRNAANDMLPRSGFPEMFQSLAEYETYVRALVEAGIIPDSTYVWWALRPSLKHRTLELRITDCCTSINDAVAIAALYRALVRHLFSRPQVNAGISPLSRAFAEENRWRAQRYGTEGTYLDEMTREAIPFKTLLEETVARLEDDIAALGIEADIAQLSLIERSGTSAHHQLRQYHRLRRSGQPRVQAMRGVCRWLRESTEAGELIESGAPSERRPEERAREPLIAL